MSGIGEEHTEGDEEKLYDFLVEMENACTDLDKLKNAEKTAKDQREKKKKEQGKRIIEMASERQKRNANARDKEDEKSDEERSRKKETMCKAYSEDADLAAFGKKLRQVNMKPISVDREHLKLDRKRMKMEREERKADRESRERVDLEKFKLMMEIISSAMKK